MFLSFAQGDLPTSYAGLCLDGGAGITVVGGCHLLDLQIYTGSFEIGHQEEKVGGFSQGRHLLGLGSACQDTGRLSTG
jgi:hypothetical protein